MSIDNNPGVLCSGVTSHKTRTKHDLVARVFPRSKQFVWFFLRSHWLLKVFFSLQLYHCDYFGFGFATINQSINRLFIHIACSELEISFKIHTWYVYTQSKIALIAVCYRPFTSDGKDFLLTVLIILIVNLAR